MTFMHLIDLKYFITSIFINMYALNSLYIFRNIYIQRLITCKVNKYKQIMKQIVKHKHIRLYIVYCSSFVLLGSLLIGLGSFIPYAAQANDRNQTEYSVLFLARAIGTIIGALSVKLLQSHFTYHKLLAIGLFFTGFFSVSFNFTSDIFMASIWMLLAAFGYCYINIFSNVAIIHAFKGENLRNWIQFSHGCFGIGGLIGPYIIYLFQYNAFTLLGGLAMALTPVVLLMRSPQTIPKSQATLLWKEQTPKPKQNYISKNCTLLICFSFLFIVGQQISYGSWVPSYAVLKKYSKKEHATFYSSLYWISITFFRFLFVIIPGKNSTKLPLLAITAVISSFVSLLLIFKFSPEFGLIYSSIMYGLSNSVLFPLLLSLPNQFGMSVSSKQNSYFMLAVAIGQGTISVGTGYFMKYFGPQMLFLTMVAMNLIAFQNHFRICRQLIKDKESNEAQHHIQLQKIAN